MAGLTSSGWPASTSISAYAGSKAGVTTAAATASSDANGVVSFTGLTPGAPYALSDGTTTKQAYADTIPTGGLTYDVESVGATFTIPADTVAKVTKITPTVNITSLALPAPREGAHLYLVFQQAASAKTVAWATTPPVKWASGTAPTVTSTVSTTDVYEFLCVDGVNWLGWKLLAAAAIPS